MKHVVWPKEKTWPPKMVFLSCVGFLTALLATPSVAWAWGPVTHVMLSVQTLAGSGNISDSLLSLIAAWPEVFLYGNLAPDIVQGRRLQSRLRRHSHNWSVAFELMAAAREAAAQVFALGYLAHLASDVIAHNFYLPMCYIANYDARLAGHIYFEACFDAIHEDSYQEILLKLLDLDFTSFDATLEKTIDSPLLPFATHRKIFEGGLKRIRQWNRLVRATGGTAKIDSHEARALCEASCYAIAEVLTRKQEATVCRLDPMGEQNIRNAARFRQSLRALGRLGDEAAQSAKKLASSMRRELQLRLEQLPFLPQHG